MTKFEEQPMGRALAAVRPLIYGLRLRVEVLVWRHGWIWPLATLSVVTAVATACWVDFDGRRSEALLQAEERRVEQLVASKDSESRLEQSLNADDAAREAPLLSRHDRLRAVLRQPDEVTTELRQLYEFAESVQLVVQQADFQQSASSGGIGRLQVSLPIKGSYVQMRGFIELLLRSLPNASVDRLVLKRNQVGQAQLEASLHLSLWLRDKAARSIERYKTEPAQ